MAQFVSYSGAGNTPIYYQPTPFAPEPSYDPIYGYGMWQKIGSSGGQSNVAEVKTPERSMVAEYYANRQPYVQFSAQQAPLQSLGYNPALGMTQGTGLYQPTIGNLSFSPTAMATPTGSYGAARFLGNTGGGLLNFSAPQTTGNTYNNSYTPQSGYLTPPNMFFDRLNATNVPILNLFGTLGNAGALNNMSYTNTDTGFSGTVGEAQQMSGQ